MSTSFIPNETSNKLSDKSISSFSLSNSNSNSKTISNYNLSENYSLLDRIQQIQWWGWLIIIIIMAYLGFNIFTYLGKITDFFINIWNNIIAWVNKTFGTNFSQLLIQTINISATGTKGAVDLVQNTSNTAINTISGEDAKTSQGNSPVIPTTYPNSNNSNMNIDSQIQTAPNSKPKTTEQIQTGEENIQPLQAYSSVDVSGQAGWCFIGEDRGTRSCMKVGANDICMSGDIFPTQDVCVNPNLRV